MAFYLLMFKIGNVNKTFVIQGSHKLNMFKIGNVTSTFVTYKDLINLPKCITSSKRNLNKKKNGNIIIDITNHQSKRKLSLCQAICSLISTCRNISKTTNRHRLSHIHYSNHQHRSQMSRTTILL